MDTERFDTFVRRLSGIHTRRGVVAALTGGLTLTNSALTFSGTCAKRKNKKKKKKKSGGVNPNCAGRECGGQCGTCRGGKTCRDGQCICLNGFDCEGTCFEILPCGPQSQNPCPAGLFCCRPFPEDIGTCRKLPNDTCSCFDECCLGGSQPTACREGRCCWDSGAGCNPDNEESCCSGVCEGGICTLG